MKRGQSVSTRRVVNYAAEAERFYQWSRRTLARIGPLRSGWHLFVALLEFGRDNSVHSSREFARQFERRVDPWDFETPEGRERLLRAAEMLDRAAPPKKFACAIEIGCAEGAFTELLAERCDRLLAVDFVPLALKRAQERRQWQASVSFRQWNLRTDPLPEMFALIVVMDVLSTIFRAKILRAALAKLVDHLHPGGYLLVTDVRQGEIFESAWWGRYLLRGGVRIVDSIAEHPLLTVIEKQRTATHVLALFRRHL